MANSLRAEVLNLYKNLLYLGREYPKGADYFRSRLKAAFLKNKDEKDPEKIKQLIARGEFVIKELEALYFLRKYRALKQRYYSDDKPLTASEPPIAADSHRQVPPARPGTTGEHQ